MSSQVQPETQYVRSPNGVIGYQVFGEGPPDLVFVPSWGTNIDNLWDEPSASRYLDRLASFSRVILFDKLGVGVSDPLPEGREPGPELWIEDIVAVMEAADSQRAALVGDTEGGNIAIQFAATYPERTESLVLINAHARLLRGPDYPIGLPAEAAARAAELFLLQHGTTGDVLHLTAPSVAEDPRFRRWWLRFQRSTMSPEVLRRGYRSQTEVDVTGLLPSVAVPTLVIHRKDNRYHRVAFGKYIAERIPGAKWVELEGADSSPFHVGDYQEILDHVEAFVTGTTSHMTEERRLATVLFTDIVGSTQQAVELGDQRWLDILGDANRICATQVARYGGTMIRNTGDGCLAVFDSPTSAVMAAKEILHQVQALGIRMRSGLHTGEITVDGTDVGGIGVHIAARVIDHAPDGGVAVSNTVKALTAGSAIRYEPLGTFQLKGVPDEWDLFSVS